jgi:uncharacterized protein (DUF2267 family)
MINQLVKDWAWQVNDGMPDPKNRDHLEVLEQTLRDHKYSEEFIYEYISQIKEISFKDKEAYQKYAAKHKMRKTTKVNIGGQETTAGEADKKSKPKKDIDDKAPSKKDSEEPKSEKSKEEKAKIIKQILANEGPLPPELRVQKEEVLKELKQDAAEDSKQGKEIREALDTIKTLDGNDRENRELLIALGQTYTERENAGWGKNSFGMADRDQLNKNEKQLMELYGDGTPEHVVKGVRSIRKTKVSEQEVNEMYDTLPKKLQRYLSGAGSGGPKVGENHFLGYKKKDGTITSDRNDPDIEKGPDGKLNTARGKVPNKERAMMILRVYKEQGGMCAYTGLPLDLESMDLEHVVGLNNEDRGNPKDHLLDRENDNNFVITSSAANQKKADKNMKNFYEKNVHPLKDKTKEDFDKMAAASESANTMRSTTEQTAMRLMNNPVLRKADGGTVSLEEYNELPDDEKPKIKTTSYGTPKIVEADLDSSVTDESLGREFDYEENQFSETRNTLLENTESKKDQQKIKGLQSKIGKKVLQSMGLACNITNEKGRNTGDSGSDNFYKGYALEIAAASPEDRKKLKEVWTKSIAFANSRDDKGNLVNGKLNGKNQKSEMRKFIIREMKKQGIEPKHTTGDKYKSAWSME